VIYTVTAYFGGGNITCSNTNTVQVVVNPVLNFTLIPRQQVCYNTQITVPGPSGATSYTWTSSTGFMSNDKDLLLQSVQPKNTGSYTLSISLGPCVTRSETYLDVLDPISFTLTPIDKTICKGDTIVLEAGVTGGSQNYAYVWNPSLYLDSPNGPKKTVVPGTSVLYNLIVHDIACPNFTLGQSADIKVGQPPQPDLQLSTNYGCAPLKLLYNSKIKPGSAIVTYDFGGILQVQRDSFYYSLPNPGTYTLNIHTKDRLTGCGGTWLYPD
jgi:hypothetical protein